MSHSAAATARQGTLFPVPILSDKIDDQDIFPILQDPKNNLQSAFEVFNDISLQLTASYQKLEERVTQLTLELDTVTEQRYYELQQKEQLAHRLETLVDSLPGGVVVLDKRGIVIDSNPVAEGLLEPNLREQRWRDIVARCFAPRGDDGHEVSNRQGKRISIVTRSLDDNGQIILLTDQTETRKLQAELSRNERLSALGKMISTLAHQVRTPLSSAVLYANHLLDESLLPEQKQAFTQKLIDRLHYMERQVRDMLLFAKGQVLTTDQATIDELKRSLVNAVEAPIQAHNAACTWDIDINDCLLNCNLDAITGAVLNLVNNSLQAQDESSYLQLSLKQNHSSLVISVADHGPGLSEEAEEGISQMFFTTKAQGTGIGLSVVRVVAQSHGGTFTIQNRPEGGACATLVLPIIQEI